MNTPNLPTPYQADQVNQPDEEIEMLLRAHATHTAPSAIADEGFNARVMSALPAAQLAPAIRRDTYRLPMWVRGGLVAAPTLLASASVVLSRSGEAFLVDATMDIATATITPSVIVLALLIGLAVVGACTVVIRAK